MVSDTMIDNFSCANVWSDAEDDSEDDMGEIDTSNIIESGRTRGRRVDYTKEVANVPEADDEEDDADFEEPATEEPWAFALSEHYI